MISVQHVADENGDQGWRVKELSLRICEKRAPAICIRIPKRQVSRTQGVRDEGCKRIVKITEVPRNHVSRSEQHFAEESENSNQQTEVRNERTAPPSKHRSRLSSRTVPWFFGF